MNNHRLNSSYLEWKNLLNWENGLKILITPYSIKDKHWYYVFR